MAPRKTTVNLVSSSRTLSEGAEESDVSGKSPSSGGLELLGKIDPFVIDLPDDEPAGVAPSDGVSREARSLFLSKDCLNWESEVVEGSPEVEKVKKCVTFGTTYKHHLPTEEDRIWHSPKAGWHAVPSIFFDFGLRIPMHPFLPLLFDALGCGFAQLSPNSFAQVMGVIARCRELKALPSLELLFAIFRVKSIGGQVYLDKKTGRSRLVSVPLSNSGWQAKWSYLEGGEFEGMKPWSVVPRSRMQALSDLPHSFSASFLNDFHGKTELYKIHEFADIDFLSARSCKIFVVYVLACFFFDLVVFLIAYFLCVCCFLCYLQ